MQTAREDSRQQIKGPPGNSALLQQPTHSQASSALPAAGTASRGLASTATQDTSAQHKLRSEPLVGAPGIIFQDYTLPTNLRSLTSVRATLPQNDAPWPKIRKLHHTLHSQNTIKGGTKHGRPFVLNLWAQTVEPASSFYSKQLQP